MVTARLLAGAARQRAASRDAQSAKGINQKYSEYFSAKVVSRSSCGCTNSDRQHAAEHCEHAARDISYAMHARCTAVASAACSAGILAYPATSARRYQLHHQSFSSCELDTPTFSAWLVREVEVGPTSTSELTCDAGMLGALSAGDLARFEELTHLLSTCSSACVERDLHKVTVLYLSCSSTFEIFARKYLVG